MSWSIRIARLFGIDIYVHFTFLLLLAGIAFAQYARTGNVAAALSEMLFVALIFATVVMHEYGHALTARAFGVATRDITLLPIGGVARLERIPENPYQELAIAVAGPAVNVVLAIACAAWLAATNRFSAPVSPDFMEGSLVWRMLKINVALVLFNMIPAFPMDGGRVLRAVLAMGLGYVRATQIAAGIGQLFAMLLGFWGLTSGGLILVLVAFFVWLGAAQESQWVAVKASLEGIPVRFAMISDFRVVSPHDTLEAVAQHVLAGFQQDFPVVDDGHVVGIITRGDMVKALAQLGRDGRVADVMQRQFVTVHPDEALTEAFQKLQSCECHSMPVIRDGRLVGLLTAENLGEFVMIDQAVRSAPRGPLSPAGGHLAS
jgi:Zn-dependent protease